MKLSFCAEILPVFVASNPSEPKAIEAGMHDPLTVKPGNKMYHGIGGMAGYMKKDDSGKLVRNITLTEQDEVALVAYLSSLK